MFCRPLRGGVNCTVLMDCCHSGTVLDLPYRFSADDTAMHFDQAGFKGVLGNVDMETVMCCAFLGFMLASMLSDNN